MPGAIWALGFVSLAMDISSEMIHGLLPVFLVSVLGASPAIVGLIEGIAEATASVTKIFSGALSDYLGHRKLLAVAGYGMAALAKLLFPLAATSAWVLSARFIDRIGKGVRDAPRDALIADLTPPHLRGAAYGLRQSLDTVGAVAGPLLATALMMLTADDYRAVFWIAMVPAVLSVLILALGVRERGASSAETERQAPLRGKDLPMLGAAFPWLIALYGIFTLARFSEAFLLLRATGIGLEVAFAPLVLVVMNLIYAISAYPAGRLSDRSGRWGLLIAGLIALIAANLILAAATTIAAVGIGVALWGLHLGLTQGIFAALVADVAPVRLRGTAFGFLNLTGGIASLLASVIAGALWTIYGAPATFLVGAALTLVAVIGARLLRSRLDAHH